MKAPRFLIGTLPVLLAANIAPAQSLLPSTPTAEEHQAKYSYTRVQPLLDTPMIDAAITKAPDGTFYLTGTTGTQRPDDTTDFHVNEGVRLWKSADLKQWEDLGVVAPLSTVKAKVEDLGLMRAGAYEDEFKGLLAPELHFIKGGVYLTYGLHPCGTGLLKSTTGKPEGPYEDVGLITTQASDASLFADDPSTGSGQADVYWVFGGGWIAKMNDAMTALAEKPRLIQPGPGGRPNSPGSIILQVGQGGAFLFKRDGTYHLLAAAIHGRLGVPCYDTWVATAKSLEGPWTQRKVAVAHGGQSTMFEGPDQQWYATFSGVDSRAALRERAAVVPVNWVETVKYFYPKNESWPWKEDQVVTEAWGWENARPLTHLSYRDPFGVNGRDGYFYISGLHNPGSHGDNINLIRGKDLTGHEPWEVFQLKDFETLQQLPWDNAGAKGDGGFKVGLCKPFEAGGTFWVSLFTQGGKRTLRSTSGTMKGPWEIAVKEADSSGSRVGHAASHPFEDHRGDMYGYVSTFLWVMNRDFSALDKERKPSAEGDYQPPYNSRVQGYERRSSDGSALLRGDAPIGHPIKVDGKYLMMGGCGWHGDYRGFGTYDSCVFWAHEVGGPWHPNRSVLPHSGNSGIFQDDNGGWWNVVFANDNFLPDGGLRCVPIEIQWNGNGYDIGPVHKQETPYVHREPLRRTDSAAAPASPSYPVVTLPADIRVESPWVAPVVEEGKTTYYLTGTAGRETPRGIDFHNNDGVSLWKSEDLKAWTPMGKVFDLGSLNPSDKGRKATSWNNPLLVYYSPPDSLEPRYDRGIITPKLYKIGADWWVLFSAGRQQVALLKSQSGKPEGPYDLEGPGAIHNSTTGILDSGFHDSRTDAYMFAYDPSFFIEDDGSVFLVFGPGWIGRMQPEIGKGLAETPRLIEIEDGLYAGHGGCQIFKKDGKYHLLAANELGDMIERTADTLHGPYGDARIAFAHSGRAGVFPDSTGKLNTVFAGSMDGPSQ